MSDARDYENGVGDVLAYLAGDTATVRRNLRLTGRRSGKQRQIDVLVQGRIFGMADATLIAECKRWAAPVDVKDVEAWLGMVEDVGADVGLMVTTHGLTDGARQRARQERGVRLELMSLEELKAWRPPGTVGVSYRVPLEREAEAERVLRKAGFRVALATGHPTADGEVVLDAFRHYGTPHPAGEIQHSHMEVSKRALESVDIEPVLVAHGATVGGGTPAHRWLQVAVEGVATDLKIMAATEAEVDQNLDWLAGIDRSAPRSAHRGKNERLAGANDVWMVRPNCLRDQPSRSAVRYPWTSTLASEVTQRSSRILRQAGLPIAVS